MRGRPLESIPNRSSKGRAPGRGDLAGASRDGQRTGRVNRDRAVGGQGSWQAQAGGTWCDPPIKELGLHSDGVARLCMADARFFSFGTMDSC